MNLWDIFFTTQATEPPKFDHYWYVSIFTLLALTFYTAYRYREKKVYQR
ncbi:MAG: TIGR02206 family membrane protein, partial [Streptococcus mitis]|nr:TIGR02206 family membrane protein [Streptococcus mitis]